MGNGAVVPYPVGLVASLDNRVLGTEVLSETNNSEVRDESVVFGVDGMVRVNVEPLVVADHDLSGGVNQPSKGVDKSKFSCHWLDLSNLEDIVNS